VYVLCFLCSITRVQNCGFLQTKAVLFTSQNNRPLRCVSSLETAVVHLQGLMIKGHLGVCLMFLSTHKKRPQTAAAFGNSWRTQGRRTSIEIERASERAIEREREREGEMGSASERDGLRWWMVSENRKQPQQQRDLHKQLLVLLNNSWSTTGRKKGVCVCVCDSLVFYLCFVFSNRCCCCWSSWSSCVAGVWHLCLGWS